MIQLREEFSGLKRALENRRWTGALTQGDGIVVAVSENARELENESGVTLAEGEALPEPLRASFEAGMSVYRPSLPAVLSRSTRISNQPTGWPDGTYPARLLLTS